MIPLRLAILTTQALVAIRVWAICERPSVLCSAAPKFRQITTRDGCSGSSRSSIAVWCLFTHLMYMLTPFANSGGARHYNVFSSGDK
jgi:hypothetical protein